MKGTTKRTRIRCNDLNIKESGCLYTFVHALKYIKACSYLKMLKSSSKPEYIFEYFTIYYQSKAKLKSIFEYIIKCFFFILRMKFMLIKVLMNEMDLSRGTFSNAVPNFPMINFMRRLRISFLCNAVLWIGCSGKPALNRFSGELVPLDRLQPAYSIKPATCTQRQHLQFEDNPSR